MYAGYKAILLTLLMGWQTLVIGQTASGYGILAGDCSGDDECVAALSSQNLALGQLCDSTDFSAYWTRSTDRYLIQCRAGDTSEDNVVWVMDGKAGLFFRLNYGRFIKKSALAKSPNMEIPDKFRARNLCNPVDVAKLRASDFILLDKEPASNEDNPYCYAPTYLTLRGDKLIVSTGDNPAKGGDPDHAVHAVPVRDRQHLKRLLDALRRWRPQS